MRLDVPLDGDLADLSDSLLRLFEPRDIVARLAQSVAGRGQTVEARDTLLFAHAPATPAVDFLTAQAGCARATASSRTRGTGRTRPTASAFAFAPLRATAHRRFCMTNA